MPPKKGTHISDLPEEVLVNIMGRMDKDGVAIDIPNQAGWLRLVNRDFKRAADTMINEQPRYSPIGQAMTEARRQRHYNGTSRADDRLKIGDHVERDGTGTMLYRVLGKPSVGKALVSGKFGGQRDTAGPPTMAPTIVDANKLWVGEERDYHDNAVYLDDKSPMAGSTLMARQRRGKNKTPTRKTVRRKAPKRAPARKRTSPRRRTSKR